MSLVNRSGTVRTISALEQEHERLPERFHAGTVIEEVTAPIPASQPIVQDIVTMSARLDELDRQIGVLQVEKLRLSYHFQRALQKNAVNTPPESPKQMSVLAEDMFGEGVSGFENSPMRK